MSTMEKQNTPRARRSFTAEFKADAVAMVLARRRNWWIAAMSIVSTGLFLLTVQIGVANRDWGG